MEPVGSGHSCIALISTTPSLYFCRLRTPLTKTTKNC